MSKLLKLLIIILTLGSCNNKVDIAAPWKETIVVYGLLDPAAKVNYLRIQKAYLDPYGNAFQFMGNNDSIYPSNLDVKILVRKNGNIIDTLFPKIINGEDEGIKKDTGLFSNTPNFLYKITDKVMDSRLISGGKEDYEYELRVKNMATGYECSAKTLTTGLLEPLAPVSSNVYPININDKSNSFLTIGYREGRNVKSYDMEIRFYYKETLISDTSVNEVKYINWVIFKNKTTQSLAGYEQKISSIQGNIFYELLNGTIVPDPLISRKALYCDILYYGAGEDLYTYIQVNIPSLGIVQKKPEYSNIANGLGIFSSRYITALRNIPISAEMKSTLKSSDYTKNLGFQN